MNNFQRSRKLNFTTAFFNFALAIFLVFSLSYANSSYGHTPSVPALPFGWKFASARSGVDAKVLSLALKAFHVANARGHNKKSILTVVDYSLPATKKRMWVFDVKSKKLLFHTYVAHGQGSGKVYAKEFSNVPSTKKSSIGIFKTGETYNGKHGKSLNLHGLEQGFNSNAFRRGIVVHNANYVNEQFAKQHGYLGRSWGCLALDKKVSSAVIDTIKGGSIVFAYYPHQKWLAQSTYLNAPAKTVKVAQARGSQKVTTDTRRT